jgi:hypothetical protein
MMMNLSFYRKHFNLINDDIPNDTKIAMNGFGGSITLPNGSSIEFIPHFEKDKSYKLIKSNTAYHIAKFFETMNIPTTDLLESNIQKYLKNNI